MKPAVASSALHDALVSGALTQIEFVEWCARDVVCDAVLDIRHFPRSDDDYLAQMKKMAADYGLTIAALVDDTLCSRDELGVESIFRMALALGAPLIATALEPELSAPWIDQLVHIGHVARAGKRHNVTVALRNEPLSRAASVTACKQVIKETDSAWLRYGPRLDRFTDADEPAQLAQKTVLLWADLADDPSVTLPHLQQTMPEYHGFLALDGTLDFAAATAAAKLWVAAVRA